jgi:hypothetical protein
METNMKAALLIAAVAFASVVGTNSAQARHHDRYSSHMHMRDGAVVIVAGKYVGRDPDLNIRMAMIRQGYFGNY